MLCGAAGGVAPHAAAQGTDPLRKTDVVRLLSNPVIGRNEIAVLIRRNCLAFHPSERDWADLRNLGADAEVLGSVGACIHRPKPRETAPRAVPAVAPLPPRVVRPAPPAIADVAPGRLSMDSADVGPMTVSVAVKDASGNAVRGEPVELRGVDGEMGVATVPAATDSLGRVSFVLEPRTIRRPGRIEIRVRGTQLAALEAAYSAVASSQSRFVTGAEQIGIAGTQVNAPLVFQARTGSGRPLAGRVISFTAQNAAVTPDQAITDGAGLAQVQVTLGPKAGGAIVIASVDSVRTQATLQVQPAAPAAVLIEHNRVRVDGGHLVVPPDVPFALSVSAQDAYGNPVPVAGLARVLEQMRAQFNARSSLLRMERVESDRWVTTVTFRPVRRGAAPLTLADATVSVEVAGARRGGGRPSAPVAAPRGPARP